MKYKDLLQKNNDELMAIAAESFLALRSTRFGVSQTKDSMQAVKERKKIARILTIVSSREYNDSAAQ